MSYYIEHRADGYYWVKYFGEWVIAEWLNKYNCFGLAFTKETFEEQQFEEIDKIPIIRIEK